jgi:putative polyhydroxyalkanoate system protein
MSNIHVARPHHLGLEAARAEVERIAARVRDEYGAEYHWDGDVLHFKRSGISGRLAVEHDSMDLNIKLGLVLSAMKGQIEDRITRKIDDALTRYDPKPPMASDG